MEGQVNSLAHFQQHSRLHFIGQWKTKAQDYLQELYEAHPEWNHGRLHRQQIYIHVDMDAYFCSVALSKPANARYRDQPVAIAAGKNNSDVSSCNYIARSFGVHAGMWVGEAKKLCPQLITLGYDLPRCEELNKMIYQAILRSVPTASMSIALEVYSVDEVVIATDCADYDTAQRFCDTLREEIALVTSGCTASCGVGPNILLARLATAGAKPNGVLVIRPEEVPALLRKTPITELHGIGRVTLKKIIPLIPASVLRARDMNISDHVPPRPPPPGLVRNLADGSDVTDERQQPANSNHEDAIDDPDEDDSDQPMPSCAELQHVSKASLQDALGKKLGEQLFSLCRGNDARVVKRTGDLEEQAQLPNAVGCSMNYAVRPLSLPDMSHIMRQVIGAVAAKLRRRHACATHARLSILERHPEYPKETTKFMGTGRCVEHHVSVPLELGAVTGEQEGHILERCEATLFPRLTLLTSEKLLQPEKLMLVEDIRGVTLQLSGLRAIMRRTEGSSEMGPQFRRRIGPGALEGQISLTAAFQAVRQRSFKRPRDELEAPVQVVVSSDDEDSDAVSPTEDNDITMISASDTTDANIIATADDTHGGPSVSVVDVTPGTVDTPQSSLFDVIQQLRRHLHNVTVFRDMAAKAVSCFVARSDLLACRGLLRQAVLWLDTDMTAEGTERRGGKTITLETFQFLQHIVTRHVNQWAQQRGRPTPVILLL